MNHLLLILLGLLAPGSDEADSDGDGLSDFAEQHKYFTDPARADSDGDGTPDGDWNERREFAYTVRTVVQVLPIVTEHALDDDYQDARILERHPEYIELEVVHYPLNTVGEGLVANPTWREDTRAMAEYLQPGRSSTWTAAMRDELLARLAADGIDADSLDDVSLVKKASAWLLEHAESVDGCTTFSTRIRGGRPEIHPALESDVLKECEAKGRTVEEEWAHEYFADEMFQNGARGTCTSTAIYLCGCLRALGIPTRIVFTMPLVDASDEQELELVRRRITHPGIRRVLLNGLERLGSSWANHTYNEVFVGGRWRRLNYDRLGQNILDEQFFGMMTHLGTWSDWSDAEMAERWALRQHDPRRRDDVFGHANGYSVISLSDRVGVHAEESATLLLPDSPLFVGDPPQELTIERVYAFFTDERPAVVDMRMDLTEAAGHFVMRVSERHSMAEYKAFWDAVDGRFTLRAEGEPDVPARTARGFWVRPEDGVRDFYLRVEPADFEHMVPETPYRLIPRNDHPPLRWVVLDSVVVVGGAPNPR